MKLPVILWAHRELIKLTLHCPACLGCTCMKWRGQLLQWGDCEQKGAMAVVQSVLDSQGGPFLSIALQREDDRQLYPPVQLGFGLLGQWSICVYGSVLLKGLSPKQPKECAGFMEVGAQVCIVNQPQLCLTWWRAKDQWQMMHFTVL